MPRPTALPDEACVYRRVTPTCWDKKKAVQPDSPLPAAFRDKEGDLSVFRCHLTSPYEVLQLMLDEQAAKLAGPDEAERSKAQEFLEKNGTDVPTLLDRGWRVARVAEDTFTKHTAFMLGEVEANGHQEVKGNGADFHMYSREISKEADLLLPDECLPSAEILVPFEE